MGCFYSLPIVRTILVASMCLLHIGLSTAHAAPVSCSEAASYAEHSLLLPAGLLGSIGNVETGNRPWAVNVDGVGRSFTSADEAVRFVRSARVSGGRYIDVGCFQLDLLYHPQAFDSLEAAFDPITNAMAAGRFLRSLQQTSSSWFDAVGHYHSSLPSLAASYAGRVYAMLNGSSPASPQQVTDAGVTMFGIHITVPGPAAMLHGSFVHYAGLPTIQMP